MTILITGATGNVGRPLVEQLHRAGVKVRAITRNTSAAFPPEVETVASVRDGLTGVSAVFLNSRALGPDLDWTVQAAKDAGVTKLVALSAINADDDFSRQPSRFRGDRNKEVEQLAVDSGLAWVSLRPSLFATNFIGMWAGQLQNGDVVAGPYASASSAPIVESDIAAVAAHALLSDDLIGQKVPLTGPQSFTNTELLAVVGQILGRDLQYREIPIDDVRRRFEAIGFPAEFGAAYAALLAETVDVPAVVTDDIERILGRPAQTFADWVGRYRAAFTRTLQPQP
ncbi:nucleoside-diphosphate sugar epimerase [Mycobacterium sp. CBMA 234]|uniref:NAD(P)H-binding protein n=1 Tax=Mycolicibacterium sp. CBMA 234 TaxID=1918495 RepID=UPI0012DF816B|nr:NAD(P)H-binding protein [Mycolicibacterium sp. CBMA 234]MUL63734.1 nucleoside-diphosphate sugar epimerase [Mycolicibacterium sp. CBMA 234]